MMIPFTESIKKDNGVIGVVYGWFTEDATICLESLTTFCPTSYISVVDEEREVVYIVSDGPSYSHFKFFELSLCAKKFKLRIETLDNDERTLELGRREEEVLKGVIEEAIENVTGKRPVVIIEKERQ